MKDWVMIFHYNDHVTMLPEAPLPEKKAWDLYTFTPLIVFLIQKTLGLYL